MNEHGFRNTIRRLALRFDPDIHIWKINDNFAGGVPDYHLERDSDERWVEIKYLKSLPKRDTTVLNFVDNKKFLSYLQCEWLNRRQERFGDACVVIGFGETKCEQVLLLTDGDWNTPMAAGEARNKMLPPSQLFTNMFEITLLST